MTWSSRASPGRRASRAAGRGRQLVLGGRGEDRRAVVVLVDRASGTGRGGADRVHHPGELVRPDERREPAVRDPPDAAQRRRREPAEPELELGADGLWLQPYVLHRPEPAIEGHRSAHPRPQRLDDRQRLLEPRDPLALLDAHRRELGGEVEPQAAGRQQAPAGEDVDRCQLASEQDRIARWQDEHARAELEALRSRGDGRQRGKRRGAAETGGVAEPDGVIADLLHRLDRAPQAPSPSASGSNGPQPTPTRTLRVGPLNPSSSRSLHLLNAGITSAPKRRMHFELLLEARARGHTERHDHVLRADRRPGTRGSRRCSPRGCRRSAGPAGGCRRGSPPPSRRPRGTARARPPSAAPARSRTSARSGSPATRRARPRSSSSATQPSRSSDDARLSSVPCSLPRRAVLRRPSAASRRGCAADRCPRAAEPRRAPHTRLGHRAEPQLARRPAAA